MESLHRPCWKSSLDLPSVKLYLVLTCSLYVLGKNITACSYEPLPETTQPELRALVSAMLQPSPQARPTVGQLVEAVTQRGMVGGSAGMMTD